MLPKFVCETIHRKETARPRGLSLSLTAIFLLASSGLALLTGCGIGAVDHSVTPTPVAGVTFTDGITCLSPVSSSSIL